MGAATAHGCGVRAQLQTDLQAGRRSNAHLCITRLPVQLITNPRKLSKADYRATISYDLLSARGEYHFSVS